MTFNGKTIAPEDIQVEASRNDDGICHILRADIDLNEFDPETIEFLNAMGKYIFNDPSFLHGLRAYRVWVREKTDSQTYRIIMNDILHRRNAAVINHMKTALLHYDTIVIPWGALHMPAIEAAVVDQGFSMAETRERISIDFKKLLFDRLLNKSVDPSSKSWDYKTARHDQAPA